MAKKKKEEYKNPVSGLPMTTPKPSSKSSSGSSSKPAASTTSASAAKAPAKKATPVAKAPAKKATPVTKQSSSSAKQSAPSVDADTFLNLLASGESLNTANRGRKANAGEKAGSMAKAVGKNLWSGITNRPYANQAQYWAHHDPTADKYVSRRISGMNTDIDVKRGLNTDYVREHALERLFDPQNRVGRESNQGTITTQADVDREIKNLDRYAAKQARRDAAADTATEEMLDTFDPQTKAGAIGLSVVPALARTAPGMAADIALTAATGGLMGEKLVADVGRFGARLIKELPATALRTARYFDNEFQNALDNGATQEEAVKYAARTALPTAAIEGAGGLDVLAAKMLNKPLREARVAATAAKEAAGKATRRSWTAGGSKLLNSIKTGAGEGVEEVAQGLVERAAQKSIYDEEAVVFDIEQIVSDYAMGQIGGTLLGGAMNIINGGLDRSSRKRMAQMIRDEADKAGLPVSDFEADKMAGEIVNIGQRFLQAGQESEVQQQAAQRRQAQMQAREQAQQEAAAAAERRANNQAGLDLIGRGLGSDMDLMGITRQQAEAEAPAQQQPPTGSQYELVTNNGGGSLGYPAEMQAFPAPRPVQTLTQDQAQQEVYDLMNEADAASDAFRAKPDPNDMAEFVDQLTYGFSTRANKAALTEQVSQIAEMWMNGEIQPAEAKEMARSIATAIMDEEGYWDTEEYDNAKGLRDYFRTTPIRVPYDLREKGRDGFQRAIRDYFGKIRFSNSPQAIPLDEAYLEAQGLFPGYLPDENRMIGSGGQLQAIMRALDEIQPVWRRKFADEQYDEVTNFIADQIVSYATGGQYGQTHLREEAPTKTVPIDEESIPVRRQEQTASPVDEVLQSMGLTEQTAPAAPVAEQAQTPAPAQENAAESLARPLTGNENWQSDLAENVAAYNRPAEEQAPAAEPEPVLPVNPDLRINNIEGNGSEQEYRFYSNTTQKAAEAGSINQKLADKFNGTTYNQVSNEQQEAEAERIISEYGAPATSAYLQNKVGRGQILNPTEYTTALHLITFYDNIGDMPQAEIMLRLANEAAHASGSTLQLTKILPKLSPAFWVNQARQNLADQGVEIHESTEGVVSAIAKAAQAANKGQWDGTLDFSGITPVEEESRGVGIVADPSLFQERGKLEDMGVTQQELDDIQRKANLCYEKAAGTGLSAVQWLSYLDLAVQASHTAASPQETYRSLRRIFMLLNPKTLLTRSGSGNVLSATMQQAADPLSVLLQNGMNALMKQDTPGVRAGHYGALARGAKQGINTAMLAYKTGTLNLIGNKYNEVDTTRLNRLGGQSESGFWKVIRGLDAITNLGLTIVDQPFSRGRAEQVRAQYETANTAAGADVAERVDLPIEKENSKGEIIKTPSPVGKVEDVIALRESGDQMKADTRYSKLNADEKMAYDVLSDYAGKYDLLTDVLLTTADQRGSLTRHERIVAGVLANAEQNASKKGLLQEAMKGPNLTEEQRKIAAYEGSETTFQNESAVAQLASALRHIGQSLEHSDKAVPKAIGSVIDAVLAIEAPFIRTPANQLAAAVEYTPINTIAGIAEAVVYASQHKRGVQPMTQARVREVSNRIARGLVGGALIGIGMMMRDSGNATGEAPDKNTLERAIWDMEGKVADSFKVGNTWMDFSNLGPALILLHMGISISEALDDAELDDATNAELVWQTLSRMVDFTASDVTKDNLWSGIIDLLSYISADDGADLRGLTEDVAGDLVSQSIPAASMLRQIAYAIDPNVREISGLDEKDWIKNRVRAGLPVASQKLPAKLDVLGNEKIRYANADTDLERWLNAMLNPASTVSEDLSDNPVVQELARLARATGEKDVILENAPYSLSGTNGSYALRGEERMEYQKAYSSTVVEALTDLMGDDFYNSLSDGEKAAMVERIIKQAKISGKYAIEDNDNGYEFNHDSDEANFYAKMQAAADRGIDMPTYLIYDRTMKQDINFKYRPTDTIPVNKSGANKGKPKGKVGDTIESGAKKGSAWAIQQQFAGELDADQMYYLWTLKNPTVKEVTAGGTDNKYYQFFSDGNWSYDKLFYESGM